MTDRHPTDLGWTNTMVRQAVDHAPVLDPVKMTCRKCGEQVVEGEQRTTNPYAGSVRGFVYRHQTYRNVLGAAVTYDDWLEVEQDDRRYNCAICDRVDVHPSHDRMHDDDRKPFDSMTEPEYDRWLEAIYDEQVGPGDMADWLKNDRETHDDDAD